MDANQLSTLSHELMTRVKKGRPIDEGLLADLFTAVYEITCGLSATTDELDAFMRDSDADYVFNDHAEDPAFCAGACWGAFGVYAKAREREANSAYTNARFDAATRHAELLATIRDNPGITQQDLGKALGKSKSNLTQILARLEVYRFFIVSPAGKYKRYRISTIGRTLLDEIEREMQSTCDSPSIMDDRIAVREDGPWLISGFLLERGDQRGLIDVRDRNKLVPASVLSQYIMNDVALNNIPSPTKRDIYLSDGAGRHIDNLYVPFVQPEAQSVAM